MVESAVFLGADRREAEQQMLQVLNLETQLANVSTKPQRTLARILPSLVRGLDEDKASFDAFATDWQALGRQSKG